MSKYVPKGEEWIEDFLNDGLHSSPVRYWDTIVIALFGIVILCLSA